MTAEKRLPAAFASPAARLAGISGVVLLCVVLPRALALGFYPYMDEGFYAYWARVIWQSLAAGRGLPDEGFLVLYPALLSWCWALPGKALVWLRSADMILAAVSGFLLCRTLFRESGGFIAALVIGAVSLAAADIPPVIQAGFRNSIAAAFIPLLLALECCRAPSAWGELAAGALTAVAVLLREPFAVFAVWGFLALLIGRGPRPAMRFAASGLLVGAIILLCVFALRGSFGLVNVYATAGDIYAADANLVRYNFFHYLERVPRFFGGALLLALGALILSARRDRQERQWTRGLFWLGATLLPLAEPALKIGFPYHFAVSLPPLAGLTAWAWRAVGTPTRLRQALVGLVCALACLLSLQQLFLFRDYNSPGLTARTLAAPGPFWPDDGRSNTVAAAARLRELAPQGGTVSVNNFSYFLYPASGLMPPSTSLSDLTRTYIAAGRNGDAFLRALKATPPDVIALGRAESLHTASFTPEIGALLEESGLYRPAGRLPSVDGANYGWLGYEFYVRISAPTEGGGR